MTTRTSGEHRAEEPQLTASQITERRRFDESMAGVKGLVDRGITKVPPMLIHPPDGVKTAKRSGQFTVPTIDLNGIEHDSIKRGRVVEQIRDASELWGFFGITNHGIPISILNNMVKGTMDFHEQHVEAKARFYTREHRKGLAYCSNFHLYRLPEVEWRDMFHCDMAPDAPDPEDLPDVCREIMIEYSKQVMELGRTLFKLLSEALAIDPNHLLDIGCHEGLTLIGHYYPPCPEPELTLGIRKHSDNNFITILLQDNVGGLQVLHQDEWVDVEPVSGALLVNIGNILQIISNDKFKSVEHRVLAKSVGPRISVASFFTTGRNPSTRFYGPIKELLSDDNPPIYPTITVKEFFKCYLANGSDGLATLRHLRI